MILIRIHFSWWNRHPSVNVICLILLALRRSSCLPSLCNSIRVNPVNVRASLPPLALCLWRLAGESSVVWLCQCHGEMLIRLIICICWHQHKCIVLPWGGHCHLFHFSAVLNTWTNQLIPSNHLSWHRLSFMKESLKKKPNSRHIRCTVLELQIKPWPAAYNTWCCRRWLGQVCLHRVLHSQHTLQNPSSNSPPAPWWDPRCAEEA